MKKLAIVITHPIQYYVPVFQLLAQQCQLKVFYTWGEAGVSAKHDPGFGKTIAWDMPLLAAYDYELLTNSSSDPGSHHGKGIVNPEIIEKISDFAPDAILIYGYIYHSHLNVMRHFKGKTLIWFRGDSTLLDSLPWYKKIAKKLYLSSVYRHVDKAFYVGKNNRAYFENYGLKAEKLIFAPHAIDNKRFAIDRKAEAAALRKSLNIAPEDLLFLFAGKLEPKKNPELLLEAFVEVLKESEVRSQKFEVNKEQGTRNKEQDIESEEGMPLPESAKFDHASPLGDVRRTGIHLLFVGNGILEESLKLKAEKVALNSPPPTPSKGGHDFSNNIHFLDFQNQSQMPVVYQACDVFCLPSQGPRETWGLAINEAMAAGKAIIASDQVGCAIDLVKHGLNGFTFKNNNKNELRQCLSYFIKDPKASLIFGAESKVISNHWTFDQQVITFLKALNESN